MVAVGTGAWDGTGAETDFWADFVVGEPQETGSVAVALLGVDDHASWMGSEAHVNELEGVDPGVGFDDGPGRGHAGTGPFGWEPGTDRGHGGDPVGTAAGAPYAWREGTVVQSTDSGWGTGAQAGSADVVGEQDAEIQVPTEMQTWTVVWKKLAGGTVAVGVWTEEQSEDHLHFWTGQREPGVRRPQEGEEGEEGETEAVPMWKQRAVDDGDDGGGDGGGGDGDGAYEGAAPSSCGFWMS